jgi:hypothetical protein
METCTQGEHHVRMEAELGVLLLQAKEAAGTELTAKGSSCSSMPVCWGLKSMENFWIERIHMAREWHTLSSRPQGQKILL